MLELPDEGLELLFLSVSLELPELDELEPLIPELGELGELGELEALELDDEPGVVVFLLVSLPDEPVEGELREVALLPLPALPELGL